MSEKEVILKVDGKEITLHPSPDSFEITVPKKSRVSCFVKQEAVQKILGDNPVCTLCKGGFVGDDFAFVSGLGEVADGLIDIKSTHVICLRCVMDAVMGKFVSGD